ncbi:MAG: antitoxin Xre/MbcA/ParS toxin-binding domain-containing protein [Bryobacteraceae bacterium]
MTTSQASQLADPPKEKLGVSAAIAAALLGVTVYLSLTSRRAKLGISAAVAAVTATSELKDPESHRSASQIEKLSTAWATDNVPPQDLRRILDLATEVFEDEDKAMRWLQERNIQTGNRAPVSNLGNPSGLQNVETVLRQIQYGVIG